MVAQGLASLLRDDFDLVGTVGDGQALIDAAPRLRPDVIIADIAMPVMDGLEALHQLTAARLDAKVIFLTMHVDAQRATAAFLARVAGHAGTPGCGYGVWARQAPDG
jgi:DNA-binding NarL/FixJ family response regulator